MTLKNHPTRGLYLSITKDDFEWEYFTAGGKGGQKQNKTASACRCSHLASGAVGISRDQRSQNQNRQLAFERCTGTSAFQTWAKTELTKAIHAAGGTKSIEAQVEEEMAPHNLLAERQLPNGKWEKID